MHMNLNSIQRVIAVFIYVTLFLLIGWYYNESLDFIYDTASIWNILFLVIALAIILGKYITEPHFSKPTDVIVRWLAVLLFVLSVDESVIKNFIFYKYWIGISISFLSVATLLVAFQKLELERLERFQKSLVDVLCKLSRPEPVFGFLYFTVIVSYFPKEAFGVKEAILVGFGFLLIIDVPVNWLILLLTKQWNYLFNNKSKSVELGYVIGKESVDFYKFEIPSEKLKGLPELRGQYVYLENGGFGILGLVIEERYLVGKRWVYVKSLRNGAGSYLTINLKTMDPLADQKTIYSKSHMVCWLKEESIDEEIQKLLQSIDSVSNFDSFVGYVDKNSNINQIKFNTLISKYNSNYNIFGEGAIISTKIGVNKVLYQLIDGTTFEEGLQGENKHGFIVGTAQKLGYYNTKSNELETVKWLPNNYEPLFLLMSNDQKYDANKFIGTLPNTEYGIPIKEPDFLVTHNTAILGILGIGKSCLTYELIQKVIETTSAKIICIDLSNQYEKDLPNYLSNNQITNDIDKEELKILKSHKGSENPDNPKTWGNEELYKKTLDAEIKVFEDSDKRILILNPDWHPVSKAGSKYKITHKEDLTPAEKTRIISERLFLRARSKGETDSARYLIVFEEAHSLVPEWNSVSNDGDKSATNGTAKVILQGRKFGLGTMVVTQRTANISKSILNQCNTIFALRVFDDTGKQFLENYIGKDYSNVLPTLEERHAVVIGKALKLKQPVILRLNDREKVWVTQSKNETDQSE